eukprot:3304817-Alexandrium_andersonii.AAC.1
MPKAARAAQTAQCEIALRRARSNDKKFGIGALRAASCPASAAPSGCAAAEPLLRSPPSG